MAAVDAADVAVAPPPPDPNGSGVFRSDDGGKTWTFMSNQNQRPMYFSQIRVDPVNDQKIFVGGNPGADVAGRRQDVDGRCTARTPTTTPSGSTRKIRAMVMVGHDGGLDISNDGGSDWDYHNDIAVGQFYQVSADMRRPYYVCGGLQDNNAWCGPSALRSTTGPVNTDWFTVAGGDGFYTRQDPTDWAIVYARIAGRQHEPSRYAQRHAEEHSPERRRRGGGAAATANAIQRANEPPRRRRRAPRATPGAADAAAGGRGGGGGGGRGGTPNVINAPPNVDPFRFYWNAPFEISPHNPAVVYMAGAVLLQVEQPRRHVVDEPARI